MTKTPEPRQRVLVAGPDPEDRELTVRALTGLGYDVVARSPSGLEAMEAARRQRPDLVLVDVRLPGPLDGPGTARAIDEIYGIPAVVVAGEGQKGFGRTPGSLPYVVLRKPFDLHDLEAAVETALRRPTPERDSGLVWAPTADRDELFAVPDPSEEEQLRRDVDGACDVDPDSWEGHALITPSRRQAPPPSDAP